MYKNSFKHHRGASLGQKKGGPNRRMGRASSANVDPEEIEVVEAEFPASKIASMEQAKVSALDRSHYRFSLLASSDGGISRTSSSEPETFIGRLLSSESKQKRGSI